MFEKLFKRSSTIACHLNAPYSEERRQYLTYCAKQGYSRATLLFKARELLWVARKLSSYPDLRVTLEQVEATAQDWEERERSRGRALNQVWMRMRFIEVARPWLRFLGFLQEPVEPTPFLNKIDAFAKWMAEEKGLSSTTIELYHESICRFMRSLGSQKDSLFEIQLTDADLFLAQGATAGWSRKYIKNLANVLKAFFRYSAMRGWCQPTLAEAIQGPCIFSQETLPAGPAWSDVNRLFAYLDTDHPKDIRDRAIVILFAIYGLRASEVTKLRLNDIDWEADLIHVTRMKRRKLQSYPLVPMMGNAIIRYLQYVRPPSAHRELFLTLTPPFRPCTRKNLYNITSSPLSVLGIQTSRRGPHALRHACAARLVSEGLTLKEIGDHLGHQSTSATRIYAKVNLPGLREVADFDLGGLL
jgi:integrase/recombinase XerD